MSSNTSNTFYITTPIYYVNDVPHIGHAYTTLVADTIARYQRQMGKDTFFITGTDEHGQKVAQAAEEQGMTPLAYADQVVQRFRKCWDVYQLSHNDFIRTTEPRHERVVQEIIQQVYDNGDIYEGEYEGWYSTTSETFFTDTEAEAMNYMDSGKKMQRMKEKNYFFRLTKYAQPLLDHIEKHPNFIRPHNRRNEVISFIKGGLQDLSISRSKTSLSWGVPLPFDENHVIYVWIDALINYISVLKDKPEERWKYWQNAVHLIGKDILRHHAIYWPALLMSAGIDLPQQIYAHGWWTIDGKKMSKSLGNVVDPFDMAERYGTDIFRYFLLRETAFGQDGDFSETAVVKRVNYDLANDLGNLLNRSITMVCRYRQGVVPQTNQHDLKETAEEVVRKYQDRMNDFDFQNGLAAIWELVKRANQYVQEQKPWELAKADAHADQLNAVLYNLLEASRFATVLLAPVMPNKVKEMWRQLKLEGQPAEQQIHHLKWGEFPHGIQLEEPEPIFPRIKAESKKKKENRKKMETPHPSTSKKEQTPAANVITIDDFAKVQLRIAEVLDAEKVENADRLLKLQIQIGEEKRQLVAGIAKWYTPEEMIGKKIVVVANLKPAKIRGVESNGMLLAAKTGDALSIVTVERDLPSGASVS